MKKYEIYLPLKYNYGSEIEANKIKQIREELILVSALHNGVTTPQSPSRQWQDATVRDFSTGYPYAAVTGV